MLNLLSIIGIVICVFGVLTEMISVGIVFIIALVVFLYCLLSLLNKGTKLTELGIGIMIISLLLVIYAVCCLFLGIDVKALLKL